MRIEIIEEYMEKGAQFELRNPVIFDQMEKSLLSLMKKEERNHEICSGIKSLADWSESENISAVEKAISNEQHRAIIAALQEEFEDCQLWISEKSCQRDIDLEVAGFKYIDREGTEQVYKIKRSLKSSLSEHIQDGFIDRKDIIERLREIADDLAAG